MLWYFFYYFQLIRLGITICIQKIDWDYIHWNLIELIQFINYIEILLAVDSLYNIIDYDSSQQLSQSNEHELKL